MSYSKKSINLGTAILCIIIFYVWMQSQDMYLEWFIIANAHILYFIASMLPILIEVVLRSDCTDQLQFFSFSSFTLLSLYCSLAYILLFYHLYWVSYEFLPYRIWLYFIVVLFNHIYYTIDSDFNILNIIDKIRGMDYGSGMAHSFYFGYLDIILPDTGNTMKGLKEKIIDYESKSNINIPKKKLYVLIPKSGFCPPKLEEISDNRLESIGSLEPTEIYRAGVRERCYKNTVYKIHQIDKREKLHIVVEGATPIKTLYDTVMRKSKFSREYEKFYQVLINQFYLTLKTIIEDKRETKDICELVYYDDKTTNVADLLLDLIKT